MQQLYLLLHSWRHRSTLLSALFQNHFCHNLPARLLLIGSRPVPPSPPNCRVRLGCPLLETKSAVKRKWWIIIRLFTAPFVVLWLTWCSQEMSLKMLCWRAEDYEIGVPEIVCLHSGALELGNYRISPVSCVTVLFRLGLAAVASVSIPELFMRWNIAKSQYSLTLLYLGEQRVLAPVPLLHRTSKYSSVLCESS